MKPFLLTFFILLLQNTIGQVKVGEFSSNNSFNQTVSNILVSNGFIYLINNEMQGEYFSNHYLNKIDSSGNLIWKRIISPVFSESSNELVVRTNSANEIFISGKLIQNCDVVDCNSFIQKFTSDGTPEWSKTWQGQNCLENVLSGFSVTNDEVKVHIKDNGISKIVSYDFNGIPIDSIPVLDSNLSGISNHGNFEAVAFSSDSLIGYDQNGLIVSLKEFSSEIQNIDELNGKLIVLTSDSIFKYDSNLDEISSTNFAGYSNYSNLKIHQNTIEFVSNLFNNPTIITTDELFNEISSSTTSVDINPSELFDFSQQLIVLARDFELTKLYSVQQQTYSRTNNQNTTTPHLDIGIVDTEILDSSSCELIQSPFLYDINIYANVLVKNFGSDTLKSCFINHQIKENWFCNPLHYFEKFENMNLAPGDSIWLELGRIHFDLNSFSGEIEKEICVYTSHPNDAIDTVVPNDNFCKTVFFGFANQQELELSKVKVYPNPATNILNIESGAKIESFEIKNLQGKTIVTGKNNLNGINISKLSSGVYFLNLKLDNEKTESIRFIKE